MNPTAHRNPRVTINNNCGNVTDSYKNVWNNCEISISDDKRQILEWISPLAPRERHHTVSDGRVDGVGDWLLQTNKFKKWHTSEDQDVDPVLFCYGDPGVGKTHMSSLVIDTLCDQVVGEDVAVACVYCDFHAQNEQSATTVLGALLMQVVAGMEPIPNEIQSAFERAKSQVAGRMLRLPEIRAMLVKSLSSLRRGFICIDALDEFPQKKRPELWDSLQQIIRECPNTRLFITGRPHIRDEVKRCFDGEATVIPIIPRTGDIERYLEMRLSRDPDPDIMDESLRADMLRVIPATISEIFLLVSLIVDAILDQTTIHQRRQTLHKMTKGLGLQDAYSTTLHRIQQQNGSKAKLGMETLMWISRSERPLETQELCHALAVELGTTDIDPENVPSIKTLLGCTLGLVTIDQQSSVRLIHFTLQEYLGTHTDMFITPHSMMAEICLTYLNFQSVCDLSPTLREIPTTSPFLHYASCYWGLHARKEMTEGVKSLALRLLQKDANHISANILLREGSVGFLSFWDRRLGRHDPDPEGYSGLHCIAYMGVPGIEIAMVSMERWDLNGRDSKGATPLMWAAKYGNCPLAKLLLERGDVNPDLTDRHGRTALIHAVMVGSLEVVKLLLAQEDFNPESSDVNGWTPLSYAAVYGKEDVVKLLLDREGVNPNSPDRNGRTPLSYAAQFGKEDVVKLLLDREGVYPNSSDMCGRTPLSHAAESGKEDVVKLLLDRDSVNPDSSDRYGQTPLSYAAEYGKEGVVKLLLDREGVNPDSSDMRGRAPLSYAAEYGKGDVVKLFLDRVGVNPDSLDRDGRIPLSYAAEYGKGDVVKLLLDRMGVNPDSPDRDGRTPLSYAAKHGKGDVVKLLLDRMGVNTDSPDRDGQTPLLYAALHGKVDVVKLLLDRVGVNPDPLDKDGRTPLSYVAAYGDEDVVKLLLDREGVNPDSPDRDGRTPLSWAAQRGKLGVVKLLLDRESVNPDSPDRYGRTPLSYAAEYGKEGVVKLLLGREGVNPDSSDRGGQTPLSYAATIGYPNTVNLLLQRRTINPDAFPNDPQTSPSFPQPNTLDGAVNQVLRPEQPIPDPSPPSQHSQPALNLPVTTPHEAEINLVSQGGSDILATIRKTSEDFPLPHSDVPTSNPLTAPCPAPILTLTTHSDIAPEPAIVTPPQSKKRSLPAIHRTSKRTNFRSS